MTIAETPIAAILRGQRTTGDGVHLVARHYKRGVRLDTHMHREAQLVYAARGTMQVTTPKGRSQLSFKSWCQRARIAAAIEKLSTDANVSVKQLASDLGYASIPAFSPPSGR
jgi:hypothetical protein